MLSRVGVLRIVAASSRLASAGPIRSRSFVNTAASSSAVKPGSESEANVPGSGSTEQIAHSESAYSGSKPDPHSASRGIESEHDDVDMHKSSASKEPSDAATKSHHRSDKAIPRQQQSQPSRAEFGASEARKQGGRAAG
ncbi:hypothetical protein BCV70DRAFT_215819 [Testicularia cyperi]|uniref:Uncharacterized protein n=1 Tax=Testicularia cyperi TaxID=1882483 RepID=A0A317XU55_9BASI|nr:hypothetical protein BCV70DRAFT_215819 [Testicularia cyperi]